MTKLLQQAIAEISKLPSDRQDELAQILIAAADNDLHPYLLTPDERKGVNEAIEQVARGEFADDDDIAAAWKRFGL